MTILTITGLLIATLLLKGRENKLWKITLTLFIISVLPFLLGQTLPVDIRVGDSNTFIDEPIVAEVVLTNPYPIPVWYFGCEWISLELYSSGTPLPENEEYAVTAVASGKIGSGLIMPWRESIIYSRSFTVEDAGLYDILLRMKEEATIIEKIRTLNVIKRIQQ